MTDQPVREPIPPDPERDRTEPDDEAQSPDRAPIRPSAAEGSEEYAGLRPPRPSQAEGEREAADQ